MLKKVAVTLTLVLTLALAGCFGGEDDGSVNDTIENVREQTVKVCNYLPTVGSVAAILTAGNPAVVGVHAIATAICGAVTSVPQGLVSSDVKIVPMVNGVPVDGQFVN